MALFLLGYVAVFSVQGNFEFLIYIFITLFIVGLLFATDKKVNFSAKTIGFFAVWVLMHMFGGSIFIYGTKLYSTMLIPMVGEPYNILKYDQFVHFYCYLVVAILLYDLARTYLNEHWCLFVLVVLAAEGIGAVNEIIEFTAVVVTGTDGVGGYTNNALDLVFNLAGAILGAWIGKKTCSRTAH